MKKLLLTATMVLFTIYTVAQNQQEWERLYDELISPEDEDAELQESTYEALTDLAAHPINLNTATREDLERIPILNAQQIEEICEYLYRYAPMRSLNELMMIESLDYAHRQLLSYFVYVGADEKQGYPPLKKILHEGKNELLGTVQIPFYERKGDKDAYLGYPYKHWIRYTFNYGTYFKVGLIGSQDAGEPFLSRQNKWGYDYYSFYVALRKLGRLKTFVVGRYRLRCGVGLILNNDLGFGKMTTLSALGRSSNEIRGHVSRSESNYLQGTAATVSLSKGLDLTGFISYRDIDATLNQDGTAIQTILKTGYHRTQKEIDKKHNASQFLSGGNLHYFRNGFHIGWTGLYYALSKELKPITQQPFRRYYPQGKSFWNTSIDYGYISRRLTFQGETATGNCHAWATLNNSSVMLSSDFSLVALQRFYSYRYYSLYSQSFSEGGSIQNESGIYIGANWSPIRHLSLMAYTDIAYFAWQKYQASAPSHSRDYLLSMSWQSPSWTFLIKYRLKRREKDAPTGEGLIWKNEQRGRISAQWSSPIWTVKTQGDISYCQYGGKSLGWMVSENIGYTSQKWMIHALCGYFHTDDYLSRIYVYERSTLYNFSFPSFFGEGIRYAMIAQVKVIPRLTFIVKLATTDYFDRNAIGSGLQKIDHSSQTDLTLQLKWRM